MTLRCTLLVEPDPARRMWMTAGVGPRAGRVVAVSHCWEALMELADQTWDLVVLGPQANDLPPVSFVAMVRTAGIATPFLVVLPLPDAQASETVVRMQPVQVVDDWTDGAALRAACEALVRREATPPRPAPAAERLRAAANHRRRLGRALRDNADC